MAYTVYCHTSPEGKKYVGITGTSVSVRWRNGTAYKSCRAFNAAIQKYGWENFEHEIIAENLTKEEADRLEYDLIKKWDLMNPLFGYHLREGGIHGKPGRESRMLMGISQKGNQNGKNQYHSPENRKQISESLKRYYRTHRNPRLGKKIPSIQGAKNCNARSVFQMDLDGNIIARYSCMKEAYEATGVRVQNICNCCTGYRKMSGGYRWKYADTPSNKSEDKN